MLNYLLFIGFIHLTNSFMIKQNIPIFFRNNNLKLNMGCDYYIDKSLYIYDYDNIAFSSINLERNRGYYTDYFLSDEDEDSYDEDYNEYIKRHLEPSMKPIVIFTNNTFRKLSFEKKYKKIIDYELNLNNKTWNDVNIIIKKEERYER